MHALQYARDHCRPLSEKKQNRVNQVLNKARDDAESSAQKNSLESNKGITGSNDSEKLTTNRSGSFALELTNFSLFLCVGSHSSQSKQFAVW